MTHYYYHFVQQHQTNYAALRPDWPNIYAAVHIAHDQQAWQLVADFVTTLTPIWFTRARYGEARDLYPLAIAAGEQLGDQLFVARTLLAWAKACNELDHYEQAEKKIIDRP